LLLKRFVSLDLSFLVGFDLVGLVGLVRMPDIDEEFGDGWIGDYAYDSIIKSMVSPEAWIA
jgi:hypothetical protein